MESKQEEDQTLWEKVKQVLVKHYHLIIIIIVLLLLINLQNSQSILVNQKGGNVLGNLIKTNAAAKENVGKVFSGLAAGQGVIGNKVKAIGNVNLMTTAMGWMFSFLKSLMMFGGMIIALAVLPGLPVFIFMLILFFILRTRMSFIKEL